MEGGRVRSEKLLPRLSVLMLFTLTQIIHWLEAYKYFVLFPFTFFEGPIVTVVAGYLSSLGFLNFYVAYGVVVLGDTLGDLAYYAAGRWGRMRFCKKWGLYMDVEESRVAKMEKYFKNHAGKTLFWGKFGYGVVGTLLFASGVAGVSLGRFILFTLPATLIKSMILLLIGFYFGYAYEQIKAYLDYTSYIMIVLAIVLVAFYFFLQRRSRKILRLENGNGDRK